MKNTILITSIIIMILWGGMALLGHTNNSLYKEDFKIQANQRKYKVINEREKYSLYYKTTFKRDFITNCANEDDVSEKDCECMYGYAVKEVGFDKFMDLSIEFVGYEMSDELENLIIKSVYACS